VNKLITIILFLDRSTQPISKDLEPNVLSDSPNLEMSAMVKASRSGPSYFICKNRFKLEQDVRWLKVNKHSFCYIFLATISAVRYTILISAALGAAELEYRIGFFGEGCLSGASS